MKTYGRVDVYNHILTSAQAVGEWSASRPGRFTVGERAPGTHWIGGWVGPRTSLDDVVSRKFLTLPGLELRHFGRQLHRLRYPGCSTLVVYSQLCWLTYLRSWALLEKPPIVQPLKNLPEFYGTRRFITVFTRALQWFLSWARSIQSTPSHPIHVRGFLWIFVTGLFFTVRSC
jgi:hypothetical protein